MGGSEPKIEYLSYLKNIQELVELKCQVLTVEKFTDIEQIQEML